MSSNLETPGATDKDDRDDFEFRATKMDVDDQVQDPLISVQVMNNSNSVLKKIANLYAEQLMSDIILVVGQQQYPAHRVILCASSDVFQVMLMKPEWNECSKRVIELVEEPCCEAVFPQFLKYLYVGKIDVSLNSVMPMLALAHKYNVQDLVDVCVHYMKKHIAKAATQGFLVSWLQYTIAFSPQHQILTEALKRFLKLNLEIVAESKDFVELDVSVMTILLQQNDLVVSSEYKLFSILHNWLLQRKDLLDSDDSLADSEKEYHFIQLVEQTVVHIRFAMMSPRELAHLLIDPFVEYHKEFFVERIAIGMSYLSRQEERVKEVRNTADGCLQFTPRLYSNDTWSISKVVNNIDAIERFSNFVTCFFTPGNIAEAEGEEQQPITWEVEFFPRGIRYNRAKMVWGEEVPEVSISTVRLRVTCKHLPVEEKRFKIACLITGVQNKINHILTVHERTEYFSSTSRVLNIDNLIPYDELELSSVNLSPHLVGPNRNNLELQVIIVPMGPYTCRYTPSFDFK